MEKGGILYEGEFKEGIWDGKGRVIYEGGNVYEGESGRMVIGMDREYSDGLMEMYMKESGRMIRETDREY